MQRRFANSTSASSAMKAKTIGNFLVRETLVHEEFVKVLENYPYYTRTKSSLLHSLRAVLSQMYIGMKHALLVCTRAFCYDTMS